eukprot:SAG31_NODE_1712_length_7468_cov_8.329896_2_plen_573_part_00
MTTDRTRQTDHERWERKIERKATSKHIYDAERHIGAARGGYAAYEIDLFHNFDNDGSGTLSRSEVRKALGGIRPKFDKSLQPLFDGMYEVLDRDGDGEIDVYEWQELLPKEIREFIRLNGESLLAQQTTLKGLGTSSAAVRIGGGREREKEMAHYNEQVRKAREAKHLYNASNHIAAAQQGQTAFEIDLFHNFDNDGSGTLSKKEMRRAMAGIRKHVDKKLHPMISAIMETLDVDGDGEIDLREWTDRLPLQLRAEIRRKGEILTRVQSGSSALGANTGVGQFAQGAGRAKEMAQYREEQRKAREIANVYDQSLHVKAAQKGRTAHELNLFMLFDNDGNGKLNPRELRRALGGIKPKVDKRLHHLFAGLVQGLDRDGDGEIDIKEWMHRMPKELKQEIQRQGAKLAPAQPGLQPFGLHVSGGGRIIQDHVRDKEQQKFYEDVKAVRLYGKENRLGNIKEHVQAVHRRSTKATLSARTAYAAITENGERQPPMRWTSRNTSRSDTTDSADKPNMSSLEAARLAARRVREFAEKHPAPEQAIRQRILARQRVHQGAWMPQSVSNDRDWAGFGVL